MNRFPGSTITGVLMVPFLVLMATLAAPPEGTEPFRGTPWRFDELQLQNGGKFTGLILEETELEIKFLYIRILPGRPTLPILWRVAKSEMASIERLSDADRAQSRKRIEAIASADDESERMKSVELTRCEWPGKKTANRYGSERFILEASTPEPVTRRAAVRLEELFAAFDRVLPPRHKQEHPTRILLTGKTEEYRKILGPAVDVRNPAIYEPAEKRIVCSSDLSQLEEEMEEVAKRHAEERTKLKAYEAEILKLYRGTSDLERHLATVRREREKLIEKEKSNERNLRKATSRTFAQLQHEAFHAYVTEAVFPPATREQVRAGKSIGSLPRWLDEGLAQIFESAIIEAGETRAETPDPVRLERIRALLAEIDKQKLPSIAEFVRGEDETLFSATHRGGTARAENAYLLAWGAAFYLTFERRKLSDKTFDDYLRNINSGGEPGEAFRLWTGETPVSFAASMKSYYERLRTDGSVAPKKGK